MPDLSTPQRLHPVTLVQRFLISLPGLVILMFPLFTSSSSNAWFSIGIAIIAGLITIPAIILQYLRFRYWITDSDIVIHSGVLTRKKRNIPIDNIQNIALEQSLLPRLFGTAKVNIETAGSASTEGVIEFVSLTTAERIREAVRMRQDTRHAPVEKGNEDVAADAEPERERLFHMPVDRVLLAGTFRFSLLYIVAIFSGLQYVNLEPDEIVDWFTRGRFEWLMDVAASSPYLAAALSLIFAALLSWITGIALNLNRFYGFQLEREEDKLHKRHGLLTVTERTIPLRRVQAVILRTNPLMRLFGWYRLELQSMGFDVQERGHHVVIPFAQLDEIEALAGQLVPFAVPDHFEHVSRLTIRRMTIRYTLFFGAAVGVVAWYWQPALWALAALPLFPLYAYLQYRYHGYAVDGDQLIVRRGVFRHHVWILPVDKFQVLYRNASFFQRRLQLATVQIDTAGASSMAYPEIIDVRASSAEALVDSLYRRFQLIFTPSDATPTDTP